MELVETEITIKLHRSKPPEGLVEAIRKLVPSQRVIVIEKWEERIEK